MKTIRSLMTLAGLFLAVFALSATGAKAQALGPVSFGGTFTLPATAQWGSMTLPAGNYSLRYGVLNGTNFLVEVDGMTKGSPHGVILVQRYNPIEAGKNTLVCVRKGSTLIVRSLEMPSIGTSAEFNLPHGTQLEATNRNRKGYTQLAEAPMLIEQIPVTFNSK